MGGGVLRRASAFQVVTLLVSALPGWAVAGDGVLCRSLVAPPGAVHLYGDDATAQFGANTVAIWGDDYKLDGTPGPQPAVFGIAARTAALADGIRQNLPPALLDNIRGRGFVVDPPTPSIGVVPEPSAARVAVLRNALLALPHVTISDTRLNGGSTFGTQASPQLTRFTNPAGVTVRGNGNASGAGIMIVDHDLVIQGSFEFRGLILVGGSITVRVDSSTGLTGNALLLGSVWSSGLVVGPGGSLFALYSSAALGFAATRGACEPSACGDGETTYDEDCDDGNTVDGDCCSAACTLEPPGAACANDGNACTADTCDGLGACTHPPADVACDDGNACTTDDVCTAGACAGTTVSCGTCMACDPAQGCVAAPRTDCRDSLAPLKSRLLLDRGTTTKQARFSWRWRKGEATSLDELDPTSDTRALCVFGGAARDALLLRATLPALLCTDRMCRTSRPGPGAPYETKIRFGADQRAQIDVDARATGLTLPPASLSLPLTVQLQSTSGPCFESFHPASSVLRQDARRFEARAEPALP